MNRKQEVSKRY